MKAALIVVSVALSAIFCGPLQAAPVIEGVAATATSELDATQNGSALNLTNNSGISVAYNIGATHAPHQDGVGMWNAQPWTTDPNPTVTFDLGGTFDLEAIHIWNGNQTYNLAHVQRGVNEFVLSVSTDGGANYTNVNTYNLAISPYPPAAANSAQTFDLTGRNGITHVRIRVNSTHNPASNDYASLSEVMFTGVIVPEVFYLSRFEVAEDSVTLAFPSVPGQVFDIYRSVDLVNGFDTPLVADIPAAASVVPVDSKIDDFTGGLTLGDSTVDFDTALTTGVTYVFVPANGLNVGREVAVVSWSGNTITVAEDIESDVTWDGYYEVRTPTPTETEWIDTAPPAGKAFYKVGRR